MPRALLQRRRGWRDAHVDPDDRHAWWPRSVAVLFMAGAEDRIAWQGHGDDGAFGFGATALIHPPLW